MPPRKTAASPAPATAARQPASKASGSSAGKATPKRSASAAKASPSTAGKSAAKATKAPAPPRTAAPRTVKADGAELAMRYIEMLHLIPREPEKITTSQLFERMQVMGYDIERRTFERNLRSVAEHFGVKCFDGSKPFGWAWPRGVPIRSTPAISQPEALTLLMVKRHLMQLLPTLVVDALQPQFEQAERRLNGVLSHSELAAWQRKILVVPPTQPLQAPVVPRNIRDGVYSALACNERFQGSYTLKNGTVRRDQVFNPLGVVLRGHVTYLVATLFDYDDVLLYALHRFQRVEAMPGDAARTPPGFDLERYAVEQQSLGFPSEHGLIDLDVTFFNNAGLHLMESPLAQDQEVEVVSPGQHRIQARVLETEQLMWWLLGFGPSVRVEGPLHLRERMHHAAREMLDHYR